jgi:S1-C subfamily serine protease
MSIQTIINAYRTPVSCFDSLSRAPLGVFPKTGPLQIRNASINSAPIEQIKQSSVQLPSGSGVIDNSTAAKARPSNWKTYHVATNAHVLGRQSRAGDMLKIETPDGQQIEVKIVGFDEKLDFAIVSFDSPKEFVVAKMRAPAKDEAAYASGFPYDAIAPTGGKEIAGGLSVSAGQVSRTPQQLTQGACGTKMRLGDGFRSRDLPLFRGPYIAGPEFNQN